MYRKGGRGTHQEHWNPLRCGRSHFLPVRLGIHLYVYAILVRSYYLPVKYNYKPSDTIAYTRVPIFTVVSTVSYTLSFMLGQVCAAPDCTAVKCTIVTVYKRA